MSTVGQVITRANEILADASVWTKGALARNQDMDEVPVESPGACQFCSGGAVYKALIEFGYPTTRGKSYSADREEIYHAVMRRLYDFIPLGDTALSMIEYNDRLFQRFDAVKAVFVAASTPE